MSAAEPGCSQKTPHFPADPRGGRVAIVTAMPEESTASKDLSPAAEGRSQGRPAGRFLLRETRTGASVLLGLTGDGARRASAGLHVLLGESPVSFLVGAGVAGALAPSLRARRPRRGPARDRQDRRSARPRSGSRGAGDLAGSEAGDSGDGREPIASSAEKTDLAARVCASDSALAVVDMESADWARAAASRGVPYVVLRAVSDTSEEDLPAFLASCLGADGSIDRAAVARKLLFHPGALPGLLAMRRRVLQASEVLVFSSAAFFRRAPEHGEP